MKTGNIEIVGDTLTLPIHTSAELATLPGTQGMLVWNSTVLAVFQYNGVVWNPLALNDSLLVHKAGSEVITGTKTFQAMQLMTDPVKTGYMLAVIDQTSGAVLQQSVASNIADSSKIIVEALPSYLGSTEVALIEVGDSAHQKISISAERSATPCSVRVESIISHTHTEVAANSITVVNSANAHSSVVDYDTVIVQTATNTMALSATDLKLNGASILTRGYNHTQLAPSNIWYVTHNLGYYPVVQSWNSTGDQVTGSVHHNSVNDLTITFAYSYSGGARAV